MKNTTTSLDKTHEDDDVEVTGWGRRERTDGPSVGGGGRRTL